MNRIRKSDATASRWFSTGFMSGGVGTVDAGAHTLKDAVMIRPGEALGHGIWIDQAFCADIMARASGAGDKGLKARFGHPNMCSEALGTFLGRWKGGRMDESFRVMADLHLSSTAAESPKGDLRKYVEEMAAKEPGHFGASIVFSMDREAMWNECIQNGAVEKEDEDYGGTYLDFEGFKSPDPANVKNLPHARCAELHAADLVDDPAATDGMFSGAGGMSLAAQMTEFLDTHPEVFKAMNDEPELLNIVTRYADELRPFMLRYTGSTKAHVLAEDMPPAPPVAEKGDCPTCEGTGDCPDCKGSGMKPDAAEPAAEGHATPAESGAMQAQIDTLTTQLSASQTEVARLTSELGSMTTLRDEALTAGGMAAADRDTLATRVKEVETERDEAGKKLAAMIAGAPPVSAASGEGESKGTMWDDARKSKVRK